MQVLPLFIGNRDRRKVRDIPASTDLIVLIRSKIIFPLMRHQKDQHIIFQGYPRQLLDKKTLPVILVKGISSFQIQRCHEVIQKDHIHAVLHDHIFRNSQKTLFFITLHDPIIIQETFPAVPVRNQLPVCIRHLIIPVPPFILVLRDMVPSGNLKIDPRPEKVIRQFPAVSKTFMPLIDRIY